MSQLTRSWLAFAALGAGVIHLALAAGCAVPLAVALVVLGFAEFGWGVGVLARNRFLVPRAALVVAFLPAIGWGMLLLAAVTSKNPLVASSIPALPMVVSVLFTLAIAASLARLQGVRGVRRQGTPADDAATSNSTVSGSAAVKADATSQPERPFRYLGGLFLGALLVAALTTPALAATQAGIANPHQHHGELTVPEEHSGH